MIIAAFAVVFLTFVAPSQQRDDHRKDIQACIEESGVTPGLLKKAFQDGESPDDNNLKCFVKCIYQKSGIMDANGNLDLSNAVNDMPPDVDKAKVTAAVDKCKTTKGADACETAFLAERCLREAEGPLPPHEQSKEKSLDYIRDNEIQ